MLFLHSNEYFRVQLCGTCCIINQSRSFSFLRFWKMVRDTLKSILLSPTFTFLSLQSWSRGSPSYFHLQLSLSLWERIGVNGSFSMFSTPSLLSLFRSLCQSRSSSWISIHFCAYNFLCLTGKKLVSVYD